MLSQQALKENAARAALDYVLPRIDPDAVLGVGTGSTVDLFIDALAAHKHRFRAAVSSSGRSADRLRGYGIEVLDLNEIESFPWYVDGADEVDRALRLTKGGGGALTREKIVASVAKRFLCIVDESKCVERLGKFPLPVEVIPMATAAVARRLRGLGGVPRERRGFLTDNGCGILDVSNLDIVDPVALETTINNIPGVVACGLFAIAGADLALVATQSGMRELAPGRS
ncbi:MAG: ribose-5-phosphate isomerase RpiA [Candidimonas sp.]|nr:MAG: ribose-5-phosphate isomerase RpiA [Candidimonas sp.]